MRVWMRASVAVLAMGAGSGLVAGQTTGVEEAPALRLVLTLKGRGVQIYNCQRRPGEAAAWVLRAPEAELLDGSWNDAVGEAASGGGAAGGGPGVTGGAGAPARRGDSGAAGASEAGTGESSVAASAGVAETGSAAAKTAAPGGTEEAGKVVGHHSAGPVWRLEDGSAVHGVVMAKKDAPEAGAIPWLVLRATEPAGQGGLTGVVEIRREETHGGVAPATGCGEATVGVERRVPYSAMYRFYAAAKP